MELGSDPDYALDEIYHKVALLTQEEEFLSKRRRSLTEEFKRDGIKEDNFEAFFRLEGCGTNKAEKIRRDIAYYKKIMPNILQKILESRKKSLAKQIERFEKSVKPFQISLRIPLSENIGKQGKISIISEIKPSSPSLGSIRSNINVSKVAKEMENAGVIGLSILTEPNYFNGSFENLIKAIHATKIPCLMKDFVFNEAQFQLANKIGATNILLINQLGNLKNLYELAIQYNLEPLIEIHDKEELKDIESLLEIGHSPSLIGVNNRNLNNMLIDLNTSKELIPIIKEIVGTKTRVISESGIYTKDDINFLVPYEADAFLIGSSIMQSENIKEKIHELRGDS